MMTSTITDMARAMLAAHKRAVLASYAGRSTMTNGDWEYIEEKGGLLNNKQRNILEGEFYSRLNTEIDK